MLKYCEGQPQARLGLFRRYVRLLGVIHADLDIVWPGSWSNRPKFNRPIRASGRPPFVQFRYSSWRRWCETLCRNALLPGSEVDSSMSAPDLTAL
jgi:hypothetical protein